MVGFDDLATKQFVKDALGDLLKHFSKVVEPELAKLNDRYMSVSEVAAFTEHSETTVRKWINIGKLDRFGNRVKLLAAEFSKGDPRVLKSDVIKYGHLKDVEPAMSHKKTA